MTLALCGWPTLYEKILFKDGWWQMLAPHAFDKSLASGRTIEFLLEHKPELVVGSNRDGCLELVSNGIGLAMRARLPDTKHGKTARWMAENVLTGVSIGFKSVRNGIRIIDGKIVLYIIEADLDEVSLLHGPGAVKESFLTYKDVDFSRSLKEQCSNFAYEGAAIGVTRALEQYEAAIEAD
jgi:HK97 family phage prohead protease